MGCGVCLKQGLKVYDCGAHAPCVEFTAVMSGCMQGCGGVRSMSFVGFKGEGKWWEVGADVGGMLCSIWIWGSMSIGVTYVGRRVCVSDIVGREWMGQRRVGVPGFTL